jgi:hypothetical protein
MNFNIIDGDYFDYDKAKEAYLKGIRGNNLRKKFGIGRSQYVRLLKRFREDGIIIPHKGNVQINNAPKYYYNHICNGYSYWTVSRTINYKLHYFGHFKTEAEAQQRVKELEENNWEGLIK